jgi:organic radical activating enzyme
MSNIKVSELFYSVQGEGRYTGVPSIFLRTFGCNFQCQGFGMPKGELSTEAEEVARIHKGIQAFARYEDLPLVHSGCDSYASWHPAFKDLSPVIDSNSLVDSIINLLPKNEWRSEHLVITGGEPLLAGWQRAYPDLLSHPKMQLLYNLTFETNGTQELTTEFAEFLEKWSDNREITFSVSAKLSCSGHTNSEAIKPEIVSQYEKYGHTYLKFVVATEDDVKEVLDVVPLYRAAGFCGPVYLMPVGGTVETFNLTNKQVAELALKYGLRYSDRLHVRLFGNQWST